MHLFCRVPLHLYTYTVTLIRLSRRERQLATGQPITTFHLLRGRPFFFRVVRVRIRLGGRVNRAAGSETDFTAKGSAGRGMK